MCTVGCVCVLCVGACVCFVCVLQVGGVMSVMSALCAVYVPWGVCVYCVCMCVYCVCVCCVFCGLEMPAVVCARCTGCCVNVFGVM